MAEENLIAEEDQDYINSLPSMNSDNDDDDHYDHDDDDADYVGMF